MNKVLLVTDGIIHPPLMARRELHKTLKRLQGYQFRHIRSLEDLPTQLDEFASLVIYIHHEQISNTALARLDAYVSHGGGILGIHTATASFQGHAIYFEIFGGRFSGHGEIEPFEVVPLADTGIFTGLPPFIVTDELYRHEFWPGNDVHFIAHHEGREVPVIWTRAYGSGHVCYASPGHRTQTLRNPVFQKVLQRGLAWICQSPSKHSAAVGSGEQPEDDSQAL